MRVARKKVAFIGIGSGLAPALLYSYIRVHPAVAVPAEPTDFFSDSKVFAKGVAWYESQFGNAPGKICGELTYDYLQNAQAAGLIARTLPEACLLAVVENPILAVRVAYVEARKNNLINAQVSLAQFLKDNPRVLLSAKQGRQLAQFFGFYAPTDLLVLTADDVRDNPLVSAKAAYAHIEVSEAFVPVALAYLIEEDEPDAKHKPGFIKRGYRAIKKIITDVYQAIKLRFNPPAVPIEMAFTVARRLTLSPELEKFLKDYFREDVATLSRLMHRSLTHEWGFDENDQV